MKYLMVGLFMLLSGQAAAVALNEAYPSCDLQAQRALKGETGGSMQDLREAHLSMRANVLQADIGNARKARRLTQPYADSLWQQVNLIRSDSADYVKRQGFLSAAERASYDRELDRIAAKLCESLR